ncbi:MAG: Fe-S cluster assembly transcriptional regulator IscR [Oleibacter sp.]|nr:Fe-S cluster assembly transcriptional regulator IscR [Thalassolituus sp.]
MRLTTKGRYAVTAMLDLALHQHQGPVSLADIAGRQRLSLSYLEQLFSRLRRNGLVSSVRGPGGGYQLGRAAEHISTAQILDAVSESLDATQCDKRGDCHDGSECLTHHLWMNLSDQIHHFLDSVSLQSLLQREQTQREQCHHQEPLTVGSSTDAELRLQRVPLNESLD